MPPLVVEFLPQMSGKDQRLISTLEPSMQRAAVAHWRAMLDRRVGMQMNSAKRSRNEQLDIVRRTQEALRSADPESALRRAGLTGTAATVSLHEFGLAYDAEPIPKNAETWRIYGETARSVGMVWGGDFQRPDLPHVQHPFGSEIAFGTQRTDAEPRFQSTFIPAPETETDPISSLPAGKRVSQTKLATSGAGAADTLLFLFLLTSAAVAVATRKS